MAAILRVKRRHDDEPLNALVISYKRQKTAKNEEAETTLSAPLTTVATFAGTVKKQQGSVEHIIQNYDINDLKANFKQHPVDVINKVRETTKQASAENRYKVVNCFRSLDNSTVEDSEENVMTVIDVEDSKSIAKKDSAEKDESYVYDLYYVQTEDDMCIDFKVSVHPYDQELVFDNYRDNGYSEAECESEDSNSESNWRNDYPDDSNHSEASIEEDDMREAVRKMNLEDGSDLSEEDDFVYAVDKADVEAYGYKYARYKARIKKELDEDEDHRSICTSDSDENNENCN
ncbi:putative RNA polymerase II nuclear localization protein SLC7A6OS [Habropoda laboriosa]|uniref:Probable RNA polymerase II nuclear localization protein SLC7A6OS n=1 Tax=Habropoda laboriosa TaxID=597456 RepID=A0A0L7QVZ9_9HYME|nr:PREDICTED: probable RNA polymerase II nuclear localization protein SLC7A6OS [Habropoda laboriosa]KOC62719.1 putative RNA polymerase II nuclear localization protein SLC7A6OS [Habropoda laboriosa]